MTLQTEKDSPELPEIGFLKEKFAKTDRLVYFCMKFILYID